MNNQFSGPSAWHDYLTTIEQATPVIEAIVVTDYYVTDTYEEVLKHKAAGRLPAAKLIFPNVELRLDVATAKGGFVNLHGACCRVCSSTSCRIISTARGWRPIQRSPTTAP
jgi:hypothetical protein